MVYSINNLDPLYTFKMQLHQETYEAELKYFHFMFSLKFTAIILQNNRILLYNEVNYSHNKFYLPLLACSIYHLT